jgi:hypothetical protein
VEDPDRRDRRDDDDERDDDERARDRAYTLWRVTTLRWNLARLGLTEDDLT